MAKSQGLHLPLAPTRRTRRVKYRVRLKPPHIDKGAIGWMTNYARKHYWRVCTWYEFDDLIADGYMIYYEAVKRYPTAIERKHIMSLFMLCYRSHIERLVKNHSHQLDHCIGDIFGMNFGTGHGRIWDQREESEYQNILVPKEHEAATLMALVAKAPPQIKAVLELFVDDKTRKRLQSTYRIRPDGQRETMNDRLLRLLGIEDHSVDLVTPLREYFSGV